MLAKAKRIILILAVAFGMSSVVFGTTTLEKNAYSDNYQQLIETQAKEQTVYEQAKYVKEIELTFQKPIQRQLFGINSKYDLREKIDLKVKNQETTSFCWAISATTVLESYMELVQNKQIEYSPRHIEYATSKTFLDGTNVDAYNREVNGGGNVLMAYGYITSGRGPVLEEEMPFNTSTQKINLAEIQGKTIDAKLEEYVIFPNIYKHKVGDTVVCSNGQTGENSRLYTDAEITAFRNQVKEHIMKYGGVTAQVNATKFEFYNNPSDVWSSTCYYCDDSSVVADHQVTIIGWDDNYAVTNFNEEHRPTAPGAYLVQNSFGQEVTINGVTKQVFDGGYIYISYEDLLIETAMTGITKMSDIDYDNIYQYDPLGCNDYITTNSNEISGANVFTKSNKLEWLNEISFYTVDGCTYEIYVNPQDGTLSNEKLKKIVTVPKKDNVSYTTVTLDEPVLLTGQEFAVAVRYISEDAAMLPVECVSGYDEEDAYRTATSNKGESFLCAESSLENWVDAKEVSVLGVDQANVCLKAFTTEAKDILLSSEKYNILEEKKITNISPNTTLEEMLQNISTNATIIIYDKSGNILSEGDIVCTDYTMKIVENDDTYKLVVTGDLNGDGKITGTDLLKLKKHIVKIELLKTPYLDAADVNFSADITSTDLLKIKQAIVGIVKF